MVKIFHPFLMLQSNQDNHPIKNYQHEIMFLNLFQLLFQNPKKHFKLNIFDNVKQKKKNNL